MIINKWDKNLLLDESIGIIPMVQVNFNMDSIEKMNAEEDSNLFVYNNIYVANWIVSGDKNYADSRHFGIFFVRFYMVIYLDCPTIFDL